jgi:hypothetical protein
MIDEHAFVALESRLETAHLEADAFLRGNILKIIMLSIWLEK